MDEWTIWLIIAVVLSIAEIFTLTAALGLLGGAALIASVFAAIGLPVPLQLVVFGIVSAAAIVLVRRPQLGLTYFRCALAPAGRSPVSRPPALRLPCVDRRVDHPGSVGDGLSRCPAIGHLFVRCDRHRSSGR